MLLLTIASCAPRVVRLPEPHVHLIALKSEVSKVLAHILAILQYLTHWSCKDSQAPQTIVLTHSTHGRSGPIFRISLVIAIEVMH